ncbi:MAG: hypothetical protein ACOCSR_04545 [Wenzhouxiangella sp.]
MMLVLAMLLTITGVFVVRLAWNSGRQHRPTRQLPLRWAGWLLLITALVPWTLAGGHDRGTALAITIVMLTGLALVLIEGWRARPVPGRRGREREARNQPPTTTPLEADLLLRRVWIFFLAGPLALTAALGIGLALWLALRQAGATEANVLAIAMISVPITWSVLVILATMEARLGSRTMLIVVPMLLGLAVCLTLAGAPA